MFDGECMSSREYTVNGVIRDRFLVRAYVVTRKWLLHTLPLTGQLPISRPNGL